MKKISLVILLMLLCACSQIHLAKTLFTYELGSDVYANPSLFLEEPTDEPLELESLDERITIRDNRYLIEPFDYLPVGLYDFELVQKSKRVPFQIKIKDTKAPAILTNQDHFQAQSGERLEWETLLPAEDLSDVYYSPQSSLFEEPGVQTVTVSVSDRFGNTAQREVEVEVV